MITVDVPPSVKHAYGIREGRVYLRAEALAYKASVAWALKEEPQVYTLPLKVTARIYFPSLRRRDIDNCMSLLSDGIQEGLGIDDSTIHEWHVYKELDRDRPRCEVEIAGVGSGRWAVV